MFGSGGLALVVTIISLPSRLALFCSRFDLV